MQGSCVFLFVNPRILLKDKKLIVIFTVYV